MSCVRVCEELIFENPARLKRVMNALSPSSVGILKLADEHEFYGDEIMADIFCRTAGVQIHNGNNQPMVPWQRLDEKYFAICYEDPTQIQIKFFFVKPEFRRQGVLSEFLTEMMKMNKRISANTESNEMTRGLNKMGFKFGGICDDKETLLFTWDPERR
tara:strand:+ start:775 stop:1251 length:477 start_codon:yes stop_codon:yes gene_type:complete